ncbi:MAG: hypothetical protein Q4F13_04425 [Pseudomonadota bacterium]|nr:hypothetical protein [Pseudomonadota bacterium]
MPRRYAFIGLTPSERSLLDSLFVHDGGQLVRVRQAQQAHLLFVNGDDRRVIERVRQDNPHALLVLVGRPPAAARQALSDLPVLRRPLDIAQTVEVLSTLDWPDGADEDERASSGFDESLFATPSPPPAARRTERVAVTSDPSSFAPTTAGVPMPAPPQPPEPKRARARLMPAPPPPPAPASSQNADVLVVTLRPQGQDYTLPYGLRRLGCRVRVIGSVREALAEIARGSAPFVFLDESSLGEQLLPLARTVNAQRAVPGQAPYLVAVARGGSVFDRLRVRMAGCTWMSAPLDKPRLVAFFARRGLALPFAH